MFNLSNGFDRAAKQLVCSVFNPIMRSIILIDILKDWIMGLAGKLLKRWSLGLWIWPLTFENTKKKEG